MTTQEFLTSLQSAKQVHSYWQQIEQWQREGKLDFLLDVAQHCIESEPHEWQKRSIFDNIVSNLALKKEVQNLAPLLQIVRWKPKKSRFIAQMAAQGHNVNSLLSLFRERESWHENHDFLALLAQQLVLRGHDLRSSPARSFWDEQVVATRHPLSPLPLFALPYERHFSRVLPRYALSSVSHGWGVQNPTIVAVEGEIVEFRIIESHETRLKSAVQNWEKESNGVSESGVFVWDRVLEPGQIGHKTLRQLPLESLQNVERLRHSTLENILTLLFSAACNGGAYNGGEGGAYGRLRAWQSLGALCGCEEDAPDAICKLAVECAWFDVSGEGDWFYNVAWDIGVVCLCANRHTLAVLCATDTD